jgi:hypothetical protein
VDGDGDEAVVAGPVDRRREAHGDRAHTGQRQQQALVLHAAGGGMVAAAGHGVLRDDAPGRDRAGARRDQQRAVAAGQGGAERLDRGAVGGDRAGEVAGEGEVVLEGGVDDGVGAGRGGAQRVEVVERATHDLGAGGGERGRRRVGAGEADDLMTGRLQLGDDRGSDPAGCACDEDPHGYLQRP